MPWLLLVFAFVNLTGCKQSSQIAGPSGTASTDASILSELTDAAKLDALNGKRAATPRLRKACYWIETARRGGATPEATMGDWLGTGRVATFQREYRPFEQARSFARSLGLKNETEWRAFTKGALPPEVPACPNQVYAGKGWTGYLDWLGVGRTRAPKARLR